MSISRETQTDVADNVRTRAGAFRAVNGKLSIRVNESQALIADFQYLW